MKILASCPWLQVLTVEGSEVTQPLHILSYISLIFLSLLLLPHQQQHHPIPPTSATMTEHSSKRPRIDSPNLEGEEEEYIQRGVQKFTQRIRSLKEEAEKERSARIVLDGEIERIGSAFTKTNMENQKLTKDNEALGIRAGRAEEEVERLKQENTPTQQLKDRISALSEDLSKANRFIEKVRNAERAFHQESRGPSRSSRDPNIDVDHGLLDGGEIKDDRRAKGGECGESNATVVKVGNFGYGIRRHAY